MIQKSLTQQFRASPSGREIVSAVERAASWLIDFVDARERSLDVQDLTLALFGISCAAWSAETASLALMENEALRLAQALAEFYVNPGRGGTEYFCGGGAITALMAAAMCPFRDKAVEQYRRSCIDAWSILDDSGRLTASPVALRTCRVLVDTIKSEAPKPAEGAFSIQGRAFMYIASPDLISETTSAIASITAFGVYPQGHDSPGNLVHETLRLWLHCALKERDLDAACPVLRGLKYTGGAACPEVEAGVRFLLDQQGCDGGFGAQRMAIHLRSLNAKDDTLDLDRQITLRMTTAAIWTLSEMAFSAEPLFPMTPPRSTSRKPGILIEESRESIAPIPDIDRAEESALLWVERHLEYFNPVHHRQDKRVEYVVKALAELAMICNLNIRRTQASNQARYKSIAEYLWNKAFKHPAVQEMLLNSPGTLPAIGVYSALRACGYEDERYRTRLLRLLSTGYLQAAEYGPAVRLDLMYSVFMAELPWTGESFDDVFKSSLLASCPNPNLLTDRDAYSFTHTIFFMTGYRPSGTGWINEHCRDYLERVLPRLVGYYIWRRDWDLAGELLISCHLTGIPETPAYRECWTRLIEAQEEDGSHSGPGGFRPSPEGDAVWDRFAANYHTTLVFLMATATSLDEGSSLRLSHASFGN